MRSLLISVAIFCAALLGNSRQQDLYLRDILDQAKPSPHYSDGYEIRHGFEATQKAMILHGWIVEGAPQSEQLRFFRNPLWGLKCCGTHAFLTKSLIEWHEFTIEAKPEDDYRTTLVFRP